MDNSPERCLCGDCATCGRLYDPTPRIERKAEALLDSQEWRHEQLADLAADHPHLILAAVDESGKCWDALTELERLLEARAMRCAEDEVMA